MQDPIKVTGFLILLAAAPASAQKAVDRAVEPIADGLTMPIQTGMPVSPGNAADLTSAPDMSAKSFDLGAAAIKPAAASDQASAAAEAPSAAPAGPMSAEAAPQGASAAAGPQTAATMARAEKIAAELGQASEDEASVGLFSPKLRAVRSGLFPDLVRASPNGDRLLNYSGYVATVFDVGGKQTLINTDDPYGSVEWLNNDQLLISAATGLRVYDLRTGAMIPTKIHDRARPLLQTKPLYAKATGDYRYVVRARQDGGFDVWPNDGRFERAARIGLSAYAALAPNEKIRWPEFTAPPGSSKLYAFMSVGNTAPARGQYGISRYLLLEIDAPTAQVRVLDEIKTQGINDMHNVELSRDGRRLIIKKAPAYKTMAAKWAHYGVPDSDSVVIDVAPAPKN